MKICTSRFFEQNEVLMDALTDKSFQTVLSLFNGKFTYLKTLQCVFEMVNSIKYLYYKILRFR